MNDDFDDIDLEGELHGSSPLEERFRELERQEELEALRGQQPGAEAPRAPEERFVLVLCPHCEGKNRLSLRRLLGARPRCGRCKNDLSFLR